MSTGKRLSIVFLNYNRLHETKQTVEHLLALCQGRDDVEIIAVDNGSTDGTAEYLHAQDCIRTLLLSANRGIAGYNEGFRLARGDYLLVLDDDSCPRDAATLDRIIQTMDDNPDLGVLACHIETPAGAPQNSWHLPDSTTPAPSPFFIGCGFAIRRQLFEAIGWYPTSFFLYQNEIEVSFQVRQRGYRIEYRPDCRVIHRGTPCQRPGWRRVYFPTRNTLWLIMRYYPGPQAGYLLVSRLLIGLGRALQFGELGAYFKAVRDAFAQPVIRSSLPPDVRRQSRAFWRQNSILHHLLGKA
ncbi:hypothetical protein MIN45_P0337 [Methylomarinovum tepidoasis]|uniref:Glycosyltransferase 2-like domain-containing protein n=1 Tax=Methylomarinovum tepidoasis TaxID=2840183 RepID=A0AAU9CTM8_9GAMM|nr:glycosyltransferase [Methylomarinovum sp. IN45]BCX87970.1 hypothetical protein MIN45_P0337 [Methylomarinovum sp. IN45]